MSNYRPESGRIGQIMRIGRIVLMLAFLCIGIAIGHNLGIYTSPGQFGFNWGMSGGMDILPYPWIWR
jgi:hypothetical protein